jgi:hypothetical protein
MDASLLHLSRLLECRDFSDGWKPPSSFPPHGREKPIRPQGRYVRHIRLLERDATARAASAALPKNRDQLAPTSTTDTAIERGRRLAASTPGSLQGTTLGTDPLRETDEASCQALTLASFGEEL